MSDADRKFEIQRVIDPVVIPKRVAFIAPRLSAQVKARDEEMVMTFPELILRGLIVMEVLVILLALTSLFFDAPLEWVADPNHTPSPAKAPWYFLGIQELLHYFPPVVAGVLIPMLVIIALIVIPYFQINIKREGLWKKDRMEIFISLTAAVILICILNAAFKAWVIVIPTLLVYGLILIPFISRSTESTVEWIRRRSLAEWIMLWFVAVVVVLTVVGTFFRGPEWRWIWPWIEGIY
jgi:quinol-cytochrome oxidoreductase complex cytochrome b subunit